MSAYYCCPIETVMRSLLPQVIRRAEIGWKKQSFVQPSRKIDNERNRTNCADARRARPNYLRQSPVRRADSCREVIAKTSLDNQTLRALVKRGLIELREEAVERDPHARRAIHRHANLDLNAEQTARPQKNRRSTRFAGESAPDSAARRDR